MAFRPSTKLEKALYAIANGEKIKNPSTGLEKALAEVAEKGIGGGGNSNKKLSDYPKQGSETNDYSRFLRAIEDIGENDTLVIDSAELDFNGNSLSLTKKVSIVAQISVVIKKAGISFETGSDGTYIKNVELDCDGSSILNGFKGNSGAINNIVLENCKALNFTSGHAFLFESYNGEVNGNAFINCTAKNCKHGFIIKSKNNILRNCYADTIDSYAYGLVSDNMSGVMSECTGNSIENCRAYNSAYGLRMYCRDKTATTCAGDNSNNKIDGFVADYCVIGVDIGETSVPSDYTSIKAIENCTFNNITSVNTKGTSASNSLFVNNLLTSVFSNLNLEKGYKITTTDTTTKATLGTQSVDILKSINVLTSGALDVNAYKNFDCMGNETTDNKISITGTPTKGQEITIMTRASGSNNFTFGGFDTMFVVPEGVKTTLTFSTKELQITKWIYQEIAGATKGKWVCTSIVDTTYQ